MFTFVGCSGVKGNTYKFESVEISVIGELTEVEKAAANLVAATVKSGSEKECANMTMTFGKDGKVTVSYDSETSGKGDVSDYTQDGKTVTFPKTEKKL